jgi:hypothetical protein
LAAAVAASCTYPVTVDDEQDHAAAKWVATGTPGQTPAGVPPEILGVESIYTWLDKSRKPGQADAPQVTSTKLLINDALRVMDRDLKGKNSLSRAQTDSLVKEFTNLQTQLGGLIAAAKQNPQYTVTENGTSEAMAVILTFVANKHTRIANRIGEHWKAVDFWTDLFVGIVKTAIRVAGAIFSGGAVVKFTKFTVEADYSGVELTFDELVAAAGEIHIKDLEPDDPLAIARLDVLAGMRLGLKLAYAALDATLKILTGDPGRDAALDALGKAIQQEATTLGVTWSETAKAVSEVIIELVKWALDLFGPNVEKGSKVIGALEKVRDILADIMPALGLKKPGE